MSISVLEPHGGDNYQDNERCCSLCGTERDYREFDHDKLGNLICKLGCPCADCGETGCGGHEE